MGKVRYITTNGELKRKDNSLCYVSGGKNVYLPVENVSEIYLYGEVSLNTKILNFLSQNNVILHTFNYYGNYSGTYYPKSKYLSGKITLEQVRCFDSNRLSIAKSIVFGICENMKEVLYHYYRHGNKNLKIFFDFINCTFKSQLDNAVSIQQIMAAEGALWSEFYSMFRYILSEDFLLNKRVKRPPDNPINALISFGNSLLYSRVISVIYNTHLNQTISYLHEPSDGRFSLSLDISEVFKPVIVFKTIFELVNRKQINVEKHFEKKLNYCILNDDGRNIFIKSFEDRIESTFNHKKLGRKVSIKTAIKLDCYKLIKTCLEGESFKPFSWRNRI